MPIPNDAEPGGPPRRSLWPTLARIAVAAALLGFLLTRTGVAPLAQVLGRTNPFLFLAAVGLFASGQMIGALRWWAITREAGFAVSRAACLRICWTGMFAGIAIPSTVGTDGVRTFLLGRQAPGRTLALSTVVFDRLIGLATLLLVALAALAADRADGLPVELRAAVTSLALLLSGTLAGLPLLLRWLPAESRLGRLAARHLRPFVTKPKLFAVTALASFCVHGLQIAAQKTLTEALDLDLPWGLVAIYHPLVVLAAAIPITPGGLGVREAAYAWLLGEAGVPIDDAVALSLLWWAVGVSVGLSGGLVWLSERRRRPAPDVSPD